MSTTPPNPPRRKRGRPRAQESLAPELSGLDGVQLARWGAAACAGGLTQRSAAKIAGVSRRQMQRFLADHAADPEVLRSQAIGEAVRWEKQAGFTLQEATSRALSWLRRCEEQGSDVREMAAALAATIQAAQRLSEAGTRRAKRLQPQMEPQRQQFDLDGFLGQVAAAAEAIRSLPEDQQPDGWQRLRRQLHEAPKQEQVVPIDVEVVPEAERSEPEPPLDSP